MTFADTLAGMEPVTSDEAADENRVGETFAESAMSVLMGHVVTKMPVSKALRLTLVQESWVDSEHPDKPRVTRWYLDMLPMEPQESE